MTNRNPDTYGMSIMRAEVRECAAQEKAREVDTRGTSCKYCIDAYWHAPGFVLGCSVMYSCVFVCIWYVFEYIWFLFDWTSMLVAGETWTKHRRTQVKSDEDDEVLLASRSFERTGQNKTFGCMADGLRCKILDRAECPAKLSINWCKGTAENLLGLGMVDPLCKRMSWNGEQAVVFLSLKHAKFIPLRTNWVWKLFISPNWLVCQPTTPSIHWKAQSDDQCPDWLGSGSFGDNLTGPT